MGSEIIVVIVVATALIFDFTNGFHDTANVVATSISTRAMPPRVAVGYAAILNFVGAFISLEVAATVANDVVSVDSNSVGLLAVFAGLVGAIAWNLITWYFGLPSSSSHALIGGMVGAVFVAEGPENVFFQEGILGKVMIPALVAPVLAFVVGGLAIVGLYRIVGRLRPSTVSRGYRLGQIISGSLFSLSHGTNDAQKTMGILFLALVANGNLTADDDIPTWVVVSAATAIARGTYVGGWRIIKTMGSRIIKMDPAQGFAAQGSGAAAKTQRIDAQNGILRVHIVARIARARMLARHGLAHDHPQRIRGGDIMPACEHELVAERMLGLAVVVAQSAQLRPGQMHGNVERRVGQRPAKMPCLRIVPEQHQGHAGHVPDVLKALTIVVHLEWLYR